MQDAGEELVTSLAANEAGVGEFQAVGSPSLRNKVVPDGGPYPLTLPNVH